jgi:hypothetical protein
MNIDDLNLSDESVLVLSNSNVHHYMVWNKLFVHVKNHSISGKWFVELEGKENDNKLTK